MNPARANELIEMAKKNPQHEFPYAFAQGCRMSTFVPTSGGITKEEDAFIRRVWVCLPGWTCFRNAVDLIASSGSRGRRQWAEFFDLLWKGPQ